MSGDVHDACGCDACRSKALAASAIVPTGHGGGESWSGVDLVTEFSGLRVCDHDDDRPGPCRQPVLDGIGADWIDTHFDALARLLKVGARYDRLHQITDRAVRALESAGSVSGVASARAVTLRNELAVLAAEGEDMNDCASQEIVCRYCHAVQADPIHNLDLHRNHDDKCCGYHRYVPGPTYGSVLRSQRARAQLRAERWMRLYERLRKLAESALSFVVQNASDGDFTHRTGHSVVGDHAKEALHHIASLDEEANI